MSDIKHIARQAADAEYRAWQRMETRTTEDTLLVARVADAVALTVLQDFRAYLVAIGRMAEPIERIDKLLAQFQPSAPPQTPEPRKPCEKFAEMWRVGPGIDGWITTPTDAVCPRCGFLREDHLPCRPLSRQRR